MAPLRLLAWEVYDKLNIEGYRCNLVTGEEQIESENAKIISSTIEMADFNKEYDVVIVDEAFMIGDKDRGKSWLNAILNLNAKEIHIILNEESVELITNILELTDRGYEIKRYEMLQKFKFAPDNFVFSKKMPKRGVFVTFSRINVLLNKMKIENLGYNVSFLYGNLPPEIKKQQISDFIDGKTDMLVTTDVIGMGINVPCDYIVFLEMEKYDGVTNRKLNPMEVKQIAGRTGRYGLSNSNAFVACLNTSNREHLKKNYAEISKIDYAYFGLSWQIFSSFPYDMPIKNRLILFKEMDFIPDRLKAIVKREDISKYLDIHHLVDDKKFDLKTKWIFLNAPVKFNNSFYFKKVVNYYANHNILTPPDINDGLYLYLDSKKLEDVISEIELYLNLTRHLNHNGETKLDIGRNKDLLIVTITKLIMDKKLLNKKKCKFCPQMLSLTHPYPYCSDCYENTIRSNYY